VVLIGLMYGICVTWLAWSEKRARTLFVVESRLRQQNRRVVEQLAPFNARKISKWVERAERYTERSISAAAVTTGQVQLQTLRTGDAGSAASLTTASASHAPKLPWALDASKLELLDKLASGGTAWVWKAVYAGEIVAAKQMYSQVCACQPFELIAHVVYMWPNVCI